MPSSLSPTDVANVALSKIGAEAINSFTDQTNRSSRAVNANWLLAYEEVARSGPWNCLLTPLQLTPIPQIPIPGSSGGVPPTSTPWEPLTLYQAGVYVSYTGQYYSVPVAYTSSASFATDLAAGNLVPYNFNGNNPTFAVPWAQNTAYQANTYVTYGNYYYEVLQSYTSSNNFLNDLTSGYLAQTDQQSNQPVSDLVLDSCFGGPQYPSGWAFQYALPSDFLLLGMLNGNRCWDWDGGGSQGDNYELMALEPNGECLFCNQSIAVIQYVQNQPDTTQWDPMFTNAVTLKLASAISTVLRQDEGKMEAVLLAAYERALSKARRTNGGEGQARRFNPVRSSRLVRSRFWWWGGGGNGVAQ